MSIRSTGIARNYKLDHYHVYATKCNVDNCNKLTNGYFLLVNKTNDQDKLRCCEECISKFPHLFILANSIKSKVTKKYTVKGEYLRRKIGHYGSFNHFKLKRNDPLLKFLKCLRNKGFKVPLFANDLQIAVKSKQIYEEEDEGSDFIFKVKLHYWDHPYTNNKGYELIPEI